MRRGFSRFVILCAAVATLAAVQGPPTVATGPETFSMRVVASGLHDPWEIRTAADGQLWVSERSTNRVLLVNPRSGQATPLATIPDVYRRGTQDGLLGLAFHPRFEKAGVVDFVYLSFVYDADPAAGVLRRMRVVRYTFDARVMQLTAPRVLLTNLPAGGDHVGGRLEVGQDNHVYLSVGDMAANHAERRCTPNRAQNLPDETAIADGDWSNYEGKILRMAGDGSIPADNPRLNGVRSHIYSYGHRNAQGLTFAADGKLYASEHGPHVDDELNWIRPGRNFGWPYVAGFRDDASYIYANYSAASPRPCSTTPFVAGAAPDGVPTYPETGWVHPDFSEPLRTFFTAPRGFDFSRFGNPTVAPSGLDVYEGVAAIPGWNASILMTSLTRGSVLRVPLSADGQTAGGPTLEYFKTGGRYRDVALAADGRTIYVSVDNGGSKVHRGDILAFTYAGSSASR